MASGTSTPVQSSGQRPVGRRKRTAITLALIASIQSAYESGETAAAIAAREGINSKTVLALAAREGWSVRPVADVSGVVWMPVPGSECSASSLGQVRRDTATPGRPAGTLYSPCPNRRGYLIIAAKVGGKAGSKLVHQLVALAFIGPPPEGTEVNHVDGDKANNRPENLEYIPHADNVRHAHRTGLIQTPRGEASGQAKLTDDKVRSMRAELAAGASLASMSRKYGISKPCVAVIRDRRGWKHVA